MQKSFRLLSLKIFLLLVLQTFVFGQTITNEDFSSDPVSGWTINLAGDGSANYGPSAPNANVLTINGVDDGTNYATVSVTQNIGAVGGTSGIDIVFDLLYYNGTDSGNHDYPVVIVDGTRRQLYDYGGGVGGTTSGGTLINNANDISSTITMTTRIPNSSGADVTLGFGVFSDDGIFGGGVARFDNVSYNYVPTITAQSVLVTGANNDKTITLADLTVTDPDNAYPADFTLTVNSGANYSVVGNTITPDVGFTGTLTVPVTVNDGISDSPVYNLSVDVVPIPYNGDFSLDAVAGWDNATYLVGSGSITYGASASPANILEIHGDNSGLSNSRVITVQNIYSISAEKTLTFEMLNYSSTDNLDYDYPFFYYKEGADPAVYYRLYDLGGGVGGFSGTATQLVQNSNEVSSTLTFNFDLSPTANDVVIGFGVFSTDGQAGEGILNIDNVTLNAAPVISGFPGNQTIDENDQTGALTFTVDDADDGVGALSLSYASSVTSLVPEDDANIVITGPDGAGNCTINVIPAANQSGSSRITVVVSDGKTDVIDDFIVTVTPDPDAPTLTGTTPADDATGIANDTDLTMTFSENVQAGPGPDNTIRIYDYDTDTLIESYAIGDAEVSISGNTVTVDRSAAAVLLPSTHYYVLIGTQALEDVSSGNNGFAGIANKDTWDFTIWGNDAPVIAGVGGTTTYTENDGAVAVAPAITVTDDFNTITSATVTVTSGYDGGEDVLDITGLPGYTITNVGGVITISGNGTPSDYQTMFRSITYENTSENPDETNRVFEFVASDEYNPSVAVQQTVTVSRDDDAPTGGNDTVTANEDALFTFAAGDFTFADVDGDLFAGIQITDMSGINAGDVFENSGTQITVGDLPLDIADVTNLTFQNVLNQNGATYASFEFRVWDDSPQISDNIYTMTIDVDPTNDNPVVSSPSLIIDEDETVTLDFTSQYSDPDGDPIAAVRISNISNLNAGDELRYNGALITATPFVGADPTLFTFMPVANHFGSPYTDFEFEMQDDTGLWSNSGTFTIAVNPVNDAPVLTGAGTTVTYTEGTPLTINALADFDVTDIDNLTLPNAYVVISGNYEVGQDFLQLPANVGNIHGNFNSTNGTLTLFGAETLVNYETALNSIEFYTSTNPSTAQRTIDFYVNDGTDNSNAVSQLVNVVTQNDAPVITGQGPISGDEDSVLEILLTDLVVTDPDNSYPADFTLTVGAGTNYTVQSATEVLPDADFYGALTVPVTVNDGTDDSNTYNLNVTINNTHDLASWSPASTTMNLTTPDLPYMYDFTGDITDPDMPTYQPVLRAQTGYEDNLVITFSGLTATIQLQAGYTGGTTQVTFILDDYDEFGVLQQVTQTYDIIINDAWTIVPGDPITASVDEGGNLDIDETSFYVNDPNQDDDEILITLDSTPSHGELTVNGTGSPLGVGSTVTMADIMSPNFLRYTHDGTEPAPDVFNYSVTDGYLTVNGYTVNINVNPTNDAPVITGQFALTTPEETALTITLADLAVTDPDNNYPADFTLTVNAGTNYSVVGNTITPATAFNGTLTVPVYVNDGTDDSNIFNLAVSVTPVNDPPVISDPDAPTFTYTEGQGQMLVFPNIVVEDEEDAVYAGATAIISNYTVGEDFMTASYLPAGVVQTNSNPQFIEFTGTATAAEYQALLRSFAYENTSNNPNASTRIVAVQIRDDDSANSNMISRNVDFTLINDAPEMADQTFTIDENSVNGSVAGTVVYNDPEGNGVTLAQVGVNPPGILELNPATGDIEVIDETKLNHEVTPQVIMTVSATDNGTPAETTVATMTININDVNEAPVLDDVVYALAENSPNGAVVGTLVATDQDIPAQTLTYTINPANPAFAISSNGTITVADATLIDFETQPVITLTAEVSDNGTPVLTDDCTVTINLDDTDDAIVVTELLPSMGGDVQTINEMETLVFSFTGYDPDGNPLTYNWKVNGMSVSTANAYAFATDYTSAGNYMVELTVSDGQSDSVLQYFWTVKVIDVDQNIVITDLTPAQLVGSTWTPTDQNVNEGETVNFAIVATDPDGNELNYSWKLNGTEVSTTANYDLMLDYTTAGTHTVTLDITDNFGADNTKATDNSETYTWNITVNDVPTIVVNDIQPSAGGAMNINEGTTTNFLIDAIDPDGGAIAYSWELDGTEVSTTNAYDFVTDFTSAGTYQLVLDVVGVVSMQYVWDITVIDIDQPIMVTNLNLATYDAGVWTPTDQTIDESETLDFGITATDPDGNALVYSWKVNSVEVATTADYSFVTDYTMAGNYEVMLTVTDNFTDNTLNYTWQVTVNDVDQPMAITNLAYATQVSGVWTPDAVSEPEGTTLNFLIEATDPDGNDLQYVWKRDGSIVSTTNMYDFVTDYTSAGNYTVTLDVTDNYSDNALSFTWAVEITDVDQNIVVAELVPATLNAGIWTPTDQTINEIESVQFSVTASDPDGNPLAYSWKLDGAEVATTADYLFETDYTSAGTYVVTLDITDGQTEATLAYTWNVTVNDIDQNITVNNLAYAVQNGNIWTPQTQTINENETLNFTIDAVDPDGTQLDYSWKLDGNEVSITDSYDFEADYDMAGGYVVTLDVSDQFTDNTLNYTWNVTVLDVDRPIEVTNLTPATQVSGVWTPDDQMIDEGETVNFAVEAIDPDGNPLTYSWKVNGENMSSVETFDFVTDFTSAGTYTIDLYVTDNYQPLESKESQESAADFTWNVVVANVDQPIVVTYLAPGTQNGGNWTATDPMIDEMESVQFTIAASDPDGEELTYSWMLDGTEVATTPQYLFTTDYTSAGNYNMVLTVSDGTATDNTVEYNWTITVEDVDQPIVVTSLTPEVGDVEISELETIIFEIVASDPDGNPLTYSWKVDGVEQSTVSTFDFTTDYTSAGNYIVTLSVTDGFGTDGKENTRNNLDYQWEVKVLDVDQPIVVNEILPSAGGNVTINEPESINFSIDAVDPDGNELVYVWKVDGEIVSTTNAYEFTTDFFTVNNEPNKEFVVTLFMTDNFGTGAKEMTRNDVDYTWNVTVIDIDQPIVVNEILPSAGGAITINEPESINFSIDAVDPDGNELVYTWQLDGETVSTTNAYEFTTDFFTVNNQPSKDFVVTLAVTDNFGTAKEKGMTRNDINYTWNVTVNDVDQNIIVNEVLPSAGGDITINELEEIAFSIDAVDPDGKDLEYSWTLDGSGVSSTNSYQFTTDYNTVYQQDYRDFVLVLDLTDNWGVGYSDNTLQYTWNIRVMNVDRAPVLDQIANQEIMETQTLTFTATATDPDDDVITYSLDNAQDGMAIDASTGVFSWTPGWQFLSPNPWVVDIIATSVGHNKQTLSDTISVNIKVNDMTIVVESLVPASGSTGGWENWTPTEQTIYERETVEFMIDAYDPGNHDLDYQWKLNGSLVSTSDNWVFAPEDGEHGTHTITLDVSDGYNGTKNEFTYTWTVNVTDTYFSETGKVIGSNVFKPGSTDPKFNNVEFNLEGLADPKVKILTHSGRLVKEILISGVRANWYGDNFKSDDVGPGVYLYQILDGDNLVESGFLGVIR